MVGNKLRKARTLVSYAESDSSNVSHTHIHSSLETHPSYRSFKSKDDDEVEDSIVVQEQVPTEYASGSRSTRSLRVRPSINLSLKALENGNKSQNSTPPQRSRKGDAESQLVGTDMDALDITPVVSDRVAIRQEIASKTATKRNRFFVEKKDFFLPLLPPHNHVRKQVEKYARLSEAELSKLPTVSPYEEIEVQPKGIKAKMKSYQLSGLSFMVYLHRNGLSGILGDEMGLGKTLQTLSLIQYLRENDPKTGTGRLQRPFLVVCPLSVLSSWMAEARKWTPDLKVIRFHGPAKERNRLKKIVVGEMDMFGNLTARARSKLNCRRNAAGKPVISLDTDSEDEEDVGVDVVVTTYDCYVADQGWFKNAFVWRYVVLDEGHRVRMFFFCSCLPAGLARP